MIVQKKSLIVAIITVIFILATILMFGYHMDYYFGDSINYINSDSVYYFELSKNINTLDDLMVVGMGNKNLIGPILYFDFLLQENLYLFYVANIITFVYLIFRLYHSLSGQVYRVLIIILLLVNPVIIASFSGPNKEITAYISILFTLLYVVRNSKIDFILALVFALFSRFELVFIIFVFGLFKSYGINIKLVIVLFAISIASAVITLYPGYVELMDVFEMRDASLGIVNLIANIAHDGLYFFVLIPKVLINFFGEVFLYNPFELVGYAFVVYLSQVLFFILFILLIQKNKLKKMDNFLFLFLLYAVIFSIPPFIQHRYFVPLYPVLVMLVFHQTKRNV